MVEILFYIFYFDINIIQILNTLRKFRHNIIEIKLNNVQLGIKFFHLFIIKLAEIT